MAAKLLSPPTNLTDPTGFIRGSGEAEIARTLAEGILDNGLSGIHEKHTHHELAMPKFDHLAEVERRSIALYVISLRHGSVQP